MPMVLNCHSGELMIEFVADLIYENSSSDGRDRVYWC
jgi:hypothetical protein